MTPKELKEKREALGLSLEEVAEITGIPANVLFLFESLIFGPINVWGDITTKINRAYSIFEKAREFEKIKERELSEFCEPLLAPAVQFQNFHAPAEKEISASIVDDEIVIDDKKTMIFVSAKQAKKLAEWLIFAAYHIEK